MTESSALSVHGLVIRSGAREVLRSVTVEVARGRITAVLGPNGAGKSTLLRAGAGLLTPDAGRIAAFGSPLETLQDPHARIGFSPDTLRAFPGHTVLQHVRMTGALARVPRSVVDEVLDGVGLGEHRRRRISQLSLGMRRRASLAAAILSEPELLLLDEPFDGLDPEGQLWLKGELRARADHGVGILVSSHGLAALDDLADHVLVLENGRVVMNGSRSELTGRVGDRVRVEAVRPQHLRALLDDLGVTVISENAGTFIVSGTGVADLAEKAMARRVVLTTLLAIQPTLADVVGRQPGREPMTHHAEEEL